MDKTKILRGFTSQFELEVSRLSKSAITAHEAAIHEESKAEDRHDTFAIEASYLAAGQAARIQELVRVVEEFRGYLELSSQEFTRVKPGAFVEAQFGNRMIHLFYAKSGGGSSLKLPDLEISVVTAESPLGDALFDAVAGDEIEVESKSGVRLYQVLDVH